MVLRIFSRIERRIDAVIVASDRCGVVIETPSQRVVIETPSQRVISRDTASVTVVAVSSFHVIDRHTAVIHIERLIAAANIVEPARVHEAKRSLLDADGQTILDARSAAASMHVKAATAIRALDLTTPTVDAIAKRADAERHRQATPERYLRTLTASDGGHDTTIVVPMSLAIVKP